MLQASPPHLPGLVLDAPSGFDFTGCASSDAVCMADVWPCEPAVPGPRRQQRCLFDGYLMVKVMELGTWCIFVVIHGYCLFEGCLMVISSFLDGYLEVRLL